jgi:hypothetical protein
MTGEAINFCYVHIAQHAKDMESSAPVVIVVPLMVTEHVGELSLACRVSIVASGRSWARLG